MTDKIFGFIGCGNMGSAIVKAVSKSVKSTNILLSDNSKEKANSLALEIGAKASSNEDIARTADIVFLGVKPQILGDLCNSIKDCLKSRNVLIVSMLAGTAIGKIEDTLGFTLPIIRIMPNTPVAVGEGMILYTSNDKVTDEDISCFISAMSKAGKLDRIDEKLIDAGSAVSGCGPAFVYMFIEAMADGGVASGLPRDKALIYATQTLLGSAYLLTQSNKHPGELKDAVCSPGGSTIAGVKALENGAFRGTVINAITDAYKRTKELGK